MSQLNARIKYCGITYACVFLLLLYYYKVTFTKPGTGQKSGFQLALNESLRSGIPEDKTARYTYAQTVMHGRLRTIRDVCAKHIGDDLWEQLKPTGQVWSSVKHDIHYCSAPKIGCTQWKKVMRFIVGDYDKSLNISNPGDINRQYVHYAKLKHVRRVGLKSAMVRGEMSKGQSFMFTREPYSRLWSAYIDKFILPDFWRSEAHAVINNIRPNATQRQKRCANDITFLEFLQYIVKSSPRDLNEHWQPVYRLCNPCLVAYSVIGKLETFGNDSQLILHKFGLENLINISESKSRRAVEEVTNLVKYNFDLKHSIHKDCFDIEDIAMRLWTSFQYNGHIHRSIDIPIQNMKSDGLAQHPTKIFLKHVLWALQYQHVHKFDIGNQRRDIMLNSFRIIPKELVDSLQEVYKFDFELFGYDKNILKDVIFNNSANINA
ncbi:carbohydrate sulfotransferase 11-like isoform X2 [Mya arenaria]|uniref:carbohydrate sulfotransferase 11-like isoform X2 n=1 Tax=Mya arenaria TaxID=6604 RepID=UPI0022DF3756|nr:carbohydrate sulfotransferase 11-like isoform X2 [Mya arenaria]